MRCTGLCAGKFMTTILAVTKNHVVHIIVKEFDWMVSSTWSYILTVQKMRMKHSDGGQGKVSQLNFIIGPTERHDDCFIYNERKFWDTWDHYPIYAKSDYNVELVLTCTDEKDEEELTKMYGPLCWQRYDKDPDDFKKTMWYGIMKEFGCKVSSTWSVCGKMEEPFTHKPSSPDKR